MIYKLKKGSVSYGKFKIKAIKFQKCDVFNGGNHAGLGGGLVSVLLFRISERFKYNNGVCKTNVLNKQGKKKAGFRIRRKKFGRSKIIKSVNKNFKDSFHSINRPEETLRFTF